jgi:hypothetical protein
LEFEIKNYHLPEHAEKYETGITLTKNVSDLCVENYKCLMKDMKEDLNKGSIFSVHGSESSASLRC